PPAGRVGPADRDDRPRHRCRALSRLPPAPPGRGGHGAQLAVLRRAQLHPRLSLSAGVAGVAEGRPAHPSRRRALARSAREDLRPAPAVAAPCRAVRLAGGGRQRLRLRRREGDGQGRARDARGDRRRPLRPLARGRRSLSRRPQTPAPPPTRRVLAPAPRPSAMPPNATPRQPRRSQMLPPRPMRRAPAPTTRPLAPAMRPLFGTQPPNVTRPQSALRPPNTTASRLRRLRKTARLLRRPPLGSA